MYTVPRNALSRRVLPSVARTPRARGLSAAAALPSTKGLIVSEGSPGDARDGIEKRRSAFFPSLSRRTSSPVLRAVSRFSRRSAFSASLNGSTCLPPVRESWRAHGSVRRAKYSYTSVRCEATVAEEVPVEASTEKYEYQAEVSRLLDLIVHSLYSNKEVFLRELVSNASDALDKLRFLSVTDPDLMAANPNLEIRVKPNSKAGIITITDTGIGMTREELVDSLGTIAQSGTAKFLQAMKESKEGGASGDNNLIGKFGVGFYSAFLVADKVTVATKSAKSDKQFVWEGAANTNAYTIREETDPVKLIPRGTTITLHLKEDEKFEFGDTKRIQNLVKNYSQFISFPIYTWLEKSREKEVVSSCRLELHCAALKFTANGMKMMPLSPRTF